jgi:hypothetical protein
VADTDWTASRKIDNANYANIFRSDEFGRHKVKTSSLHDNDRQRGTHQIQLGSQCIGVKWEPAR